MIKEMKVKLLALAVLGWAGVSSVHAQGWSHTTNAGDPSYSGYATVQAGTCQQVAYTYGGPPVQVINDGPLADFNDTTLDHEDYISGSVSAGTYYIYQYVYTSEENDNAGGTSVTAFSW